MAAAFAMAVLLALLGILVVWAWVGRQWVVVVCAAAPTSLALVVAVGVSQIWWLSGFGWAALATAAGLAAAVGLGWRGLRGRWMRGNAVAAKAASPVGSAGQGRAAGALAAILTLTLACALGTLWLAGGHTLGLVSQTWDAIFDVNAIRYVHETGDAAPTRLTSFAYGSTGGGYYPSAFASLGALAMGLGVADAITASNVVAALIAGLFWPSAVALATGLMFGFGRALPALAAFLSLGFTAMAWAPLGWGVLWATSIAACFAPIAIAGVGRVIQRWRTEQIVDRLGLVLGGVGFGLTTVSHPRIAIIVLLLWVGLAQCGLLVWSVGSGASGRARRLLIAAGVSVAFWVPASLFILTFRRGDSQFGVRGWTVERGLLAELFGYLVNGPNGSLPLLVTALAVAVGVAVVWRGPAAWVVVMLVGAVALDVLTATTRGVTAWNGIARFWYTDRHRTITVPPALAVPLAAVGVRWLLDRPLLGGAGLRAFASTDAGDGPGRGWSARGLAVAAVAGAVVVGSGIVAAVGVVRPSYSEAAADPVAALLTPHEVEFYREVAALVPPDARILNNANDGSALLYAVTGVKPVFMVAGTVSSTPNGAWLRSQGVTLEPSNFCYLTDLDHIGWVLRSGRPYNEGILSEDAPNLHIPDDYFATTPVLRDGDLILYQITGCPAP